MFEMKKPITALEMKVLCNIASKGEAAFRLQEVEKCWMDDLKVLQHMWFLH